MEIRASVTYLIIHSRIVSPMYVMHMAAHTHTALQRNFVTELGSCCDIFDCTSKPKQCMHWHLHFVTFIIFYCFNVI